MPKNLSAHHQRPTPEKIYLERYAEPEASLSEELAEGFRSTGFSPDRVLIVPACGELENLPTCVDSAVQAARCSGVSLLMILVINNRADSLSCFRENNLATLLEWRQRLGECHAFTSQPGAGYRGNYRGQTLVILDRSSPSRELPLGQGVGLARKIGSDLAIGLWDQACLKTSLAHTTDADATLPEDYFFCPRKAGIKAGVSALVYPFEHVSPPGASIRQVQAMEAYHQYLLHYQEGLQKAGSPYAYHSLGSVICFSLPAYARVRGFPKREAGEDFYFLNKLRKLGEVISAPTRPVILQGRFSSRVPFGTGPAIRAMTMNPSPAPQFGHYPGEAYQVLGGFLKAGESYCEHGNLETFLEELTRSFTLQIRGTGLKETLALAESLGLEKFLRELRAKAKTSARRRSHFMTWFDGLKTLRLIHFVRDQKSCLKFHGSGLQN